MDFVDFKLSSVLEENILSLGYASPTPIQDQAIPHVLQGRDIAGLAQTGTGKTAAFLVPLIERILRSEEYIQNPASELFFTDSAGENHKDDKNDNHKDDLKFDHKGDRNQDSKGDAKHDNRRSLKNRVIQDWKSNQFFLVLLPTRELAEQVLENFNSLSKNTSLKAVSIYGGTGYEKQIDALKKGVQFIFATPGRLIDLYKEHLVDLKQVRGIVFDEADRMFDMGFKDDMKYILQRVPNDRQFLVFSATLNLEVLNTAYQFGANPVEINISRDKTSADNVKDFLYHVGDNEKPQQLISLLKKNKPKQAIIFTNFKHNVERVAQFLSQNNFPAIAISSLLTQAQRTRVLAQFKESNNINIMVATDIAARGLDIQGVDLVINYDLPSDCETYVHRIGRTGRANSLGTAYSLCSDKDVESLARIEEFLKRKIENQYLEDHELIKDFKEFRAIRTQSFNKRPQSFDSKRKPFENKEYKGLSRRKDSKGTADRNAQRNPDRKKISKANNKPFIQHKTDKPYKYGHKTTPKVTTHHKAKPATTTVSKEAGIGSRVIGFFQKLFKG